MSALSDLARVLDFITEWRRFAPWVHDSQVEQDLILSRTLTEIFNVPEAADALAFRGGTALYLSARGERPTFAHEK